MARPLRIEYAHAFYHVVSRGNERKPIFKEPSDYKLFFKTLEDASNYYGVFLHSFCLMPNHIHLLVETPEPNLSHFMKRLLGVYTMRFNRKHKRHGHLFQGRYKAILVEEDVYLVPLSRYIHLNPIKAKLSRDLEYAYSSLRFFLTANAPAYLKTKFLLDFFPSKRKFLDYIKEGLDDNTPLPKPRLGNILGGEKFINRIKDRMSQKPLVNVAFRNDYMSCPPERLDPFIREESKSFQIYCLRMLSKLPQKQLGERFNLTYSAISKAVKRFEPSIKEDREVQRKFEAIRMEVSNFKN